MSSFHQLELCFQLISTLRFNFLIQIPILMEANSIVDHLSNEYTYSKGYFKHSFSFGIH